MSVRISITFGASSASVLTLMRRYISLILSYDPSTIFLINSLSDYKKNFELAKKYSRSGEVIIEKFVGGEEISVNAYLVEGKLKFIEVSDRETWSEYTGLIKKHLVPSKLITNDLKNRLQKLIMDSCQRIGIKNGPVYYQIKIENQIPYIIEMTPRLDGCHMWKLLKYYSGTNILKLTFEHLFNNDYSELNNAINENTGMELEFYCQKPGTLMNQNNFEIPQRAMENFFYYYTGNKIRPVNGKYDKVGYNIKESD